MYTKEDVLTALKDAVSSKHYTAITLNNQEGYRGIGVDRWAATNLIGVTSSGEFPTAEELFAVVNDDYAANPDSYRIAGNEVTLVLQPNS